MSSPQSIAVVNNRARAQPPASVLMTADAVGGVWRYTVDLGRALTARGVTTTVAVMGPAPNVSQRREARGAGLAVIHRPYRLEWMEDPWSDVGRAGEWLLTLERAVRPTVVHLNGYVHAALPWSAPVLVVAHSCVRTWWKAVKNESPPSSVDRYTEAVSAGLTAARTVIAPSAAMLAALGAEYGAFGDVQIIPNGCANAATCAERVTAAKMHLVLSAGRAWDEAKNIASICAIADRLTWPLYVAGSCRRPGGAISDLPAVHRLGHLATRALAGWYRRASIYVLPARYEPFGLSVLEAASAGCALVLGDIASLRENWDGAALFVPPADRTALASAVQGLIDHPEARIDLGRRALARASAFTIDRTADAYLRAYEKLAA